MSHLLAFDIAACTTEVKKKWMNEKAKEKKKKKSESERERKREKVERRQNDEPHTKDAADR